jgi:glycosyltransferase involved in cell wall biosynthesis
VDLRVWIVNQYVNLPDQPGQTRHYSLGRELVRRGHEVTVVTSSFSHMTRQEMVLAPGEQWKHQQVDGITFAWLRTPSYSGNSLARLWNILLFAFRVWFGVGLQGLPAPEIIIGSSPFPSAACAAERLARRCGVPFVLEVRDLWPQTLIDLGRLSPRHPVVWVLERLERYLYRRAAAIISLLPKAAEHMTAKGARPEQVLWLPNGIDLSQVPISSPCLRTPPFTVVYAGSHNRSNNLDTLLDAAALLQQQGFSGRMMLRLIGDGPEKARLQRRALEESISLVRFEPALPKSRIYQALGEADAFVIDHPDSPLYRWGVSPNKLFDYLAVGRPIICGIEAGGTPVEEAAAGLVIPPGDPAAMADAIRQLAQSPITDRLAMGERGRAYAALHHDYARLAEQLEETLRRCLGTALREREVLRH